MISRTIHSLALLALLATAATAQAYELELSPTPAQPYIPMDLLVHADVEPAIVGASVSREGNIVRVRAQIIAVPVAPITYRYALGTFPPGNYSIEFYTRLTSVTTPPNQPFALVATLPMVIAGNPLEPEPVPLAAGTSLLAMSLLLLLTAGLALRSRVRLRPR